jgi:hypothetical protein
MQEEKLSFRERKSYLTFKKVKDVSYFSYNFLKAYSPIKKIVVNGIKEDGLRLVGLMLLIGGIIGLDKCEKAKSNSANEIYQTESVQVNSLHSDSIYLSRINSDTIKHLKSIDDTVQ